MSEFFIETERMILRPLRMDDVDDLYEYQSHPEIVRYIPWPERSREQVIEALEKHAPDSKSELREDGDYLLLAWELKDLTDDQKYSKTTAVDNYRPGKVIGQSNARYESSRDSLADIGWVTHQDFQRQGFALEATQALMAHIFNGSAVRRLIANIDTRNPESAKLAEKLGMRREGEFKEAEFFKGEWCSMWLYAILTSEFKA